MINVPSQDSLDVLNRLVVIQARDPKDVDSLLRLQVSHVPKGIVADWLPSEEIGLRKLLIRNSGEGNRSAGTELLSLRDPWTPEGLDIRLVSE